jgi:anti-sigma factor RsiW
VNQSCLDIQSHLSTWLDGELAGDVSEVVRDHLAECSECRAFAEALQQLDTTFEKSAAIHNEAVARIAVNVLSSIANDRTSGPEVAVYFRLVSFDRYHVTVVVRLVGGVY